MTESFAIAGVVAAHGIKGEMKLFPLSPETATFSGLKTCRIGLNRQEAEPFTIRRLAPAGRFYLLSLVGVETRQDAEKWKGCTVFAAREEVAPLREGTYFVCDLLGLEVVSREGRLLGRLVEVSSNGYQDLLIVHLEGEADILIPVTERFFLGADLEGGRIKVDPPEGLIELYRSS